MPKLKLQHFGHLIFQRAHSLEKTLMLEELKAKREEGRRGWHGYIASPAQWIRIGATPGDSKGQGYLVVHGVSESDTT